MIFECEWTKQNGVKVYWDGEEITDEPIQTNESPKVHIDGVPKGVKEYAAQFVASQSFPDEEKLQVGIKQLAAIAANDFKERDVE